MSSVLLRKDWPEGSLIGANKYNSGERGETLYNCIILTGNKISALESVLVFASISRSFNLHKIKRYKIQDTILHINIILKLQFLPIDYCENRE